eukprot:gene14109-biopygen9138
MCVQPYKVWDHVLDLARRPFVAARAARLRAVSVDVDRVRPDDRHPPPTDAEAKAEAEVMGDAKAAHGSIAMAPSGLLKAQNWPTLLEPHSERNSVHVHTPITRHNPNRVADPPALP